MYFLPVLRSIPFLGMSISNKWLWTMDISPGYVGQGMIAGPAITLHMLLGAIFGWGVLSPMAQRNGWATGAVGNWETGSRGWIIWISQAALLADCVAKISWFLIRPLWNIRYSFYKTQMHLAGKNRSVCFSVNYRATQQALLINST